MRVRAAGNKDYKPAGMQTLNPVRAAGNFQRSAAYLGILFLTFWIPLCV